MSDFGMSQQALSRQNLRETYIYPSFGPSLSESSVDTRLRSAEFTQFCRFQKFSDQSSDTLKYLLKRFVS